MNEPSVTTRECRLTKSLCEASLACKWERGVTLNNQRKLLFAKVLEDDGLSYKCVCFAPSFSYDEPSYVAEMIGEIGWVDTFNPIHSGEIPEWQEVLMDEILHLHPSILA